MRVYVCPAAEQIHRKKVWLPRNNFLKVYTSVVLHLLHQRWSVRLMCHQTINWNTVSQATDSESAGHVVRKNQKCFCSFICRGAAGSLHTSHSSAPVVNDTGKQCLPDDVYSLWVVKMVYYRWTFFVSRFPPFFLTDSEQQHTLASLLEAPSAKKHNHTSCSAF